MIPSDPEEDSPWDKSDASSSPDGTDDEENDGGSDGESKDEEGEESKCSDGDVENEKEEPADGSADEDDTGLIDEIRKRKLVEEPPPEVDTCSAVDVQFAPETLDVAVAFKRKIKTYFISVNNTLEEAKCYTFPKPYKTLTALTYDSSGTRVFALSGTDLIVVDLEEDEDTEPKSYTLFSSKAVKIANGEGFVAVGDDQGNIYVVNSESFQLQFYVNVGEGDQTESLAIENSTVYATVGFRAVRIDVATKKITAEEEHACDLLAGVTQKMSFVTGSTSGELVMFRLSDLTPQGSYKIAKKTSVTALAVVDATRIAVALDNGQIKLYGLFPNVEIGIVGSVEASATAMTSSCDGEWLFVNDHFHNCKLFSLTGLDDAPVKKRKARREKHLPSSSCENKDAFFSLM